MLVRDLFDDATYADTIERLEKLSPDAKALWGKMNVSQMLAHCKVAFRVPLTDKPLPRMFAGRLIGWAIKSKLYNDSLWGKGLPTAPEFIIKDERDFDTEKKKLLALIREFHDRGPEGAGKYPHPFFGKFTKEQWGKSMWKHMDHHLRQFGA